VGNEHYDVFISYSRAHARHAVDIDLVLRQKGLRTFFDRSNLPAGLPWVRAVEQAIVAAKTVVVLIGSGGLGNTQQFERELAFVRQKDNPGFPVVPVLLPEARDPPFNFLQTLTWVDFSQVTRISDAPSELMRLLAAVHGGVPDLGAKRDEICPFRGLDAFREEDSEFFFGRGSADDCASDIGNLVCKVREHQFVMVVGRSGSGKSSLVFAGLLPALRRERDRFWNVLSMRPGSDPLRALAASFNPRADDEGAAAFANRMNREVEELRKGDPKLLADMIRDVLGEAEGKPDRLLLYVDQWEELYAQGSAQKDRQHGADVKRFIDLLLNATRSAPVSVIGTIRADFYDPLIAHQEIKALLPAQQILLGSMTPSELEHTIVEPAVKVGLKFDPPGLVQQILDEAGEEEGMLPLLQYALKETWAQREGQSLTADSYMRSGGVREAIRNTAERTFNSLSPADQRAARQLFLRLVTPGEGQEDTRARATMPAEPDQREIVEQFAGPRTRLLVTGWDRAARPTVEVAHEALIRTWPRLRNWIDANREKLLSRTAVVKAKAEWEQQGRREDLLLPSGFQLERARALLKEPGDIAVNDIQEFVAASVAHETEKIARNQEAERRLREAELERERLAREAAEKAQELAAERATAAEAQRAAAKAEAERADERARTARRGQIQAFAAAGVLTLLVAFAWVQWRRADRELNTAQKAQSHFLANLSRQLRNSGDAGTALLLALEALPDDAIANSRPYVPEPELQLDSALYALHERVVLKGHEGSVVSAAFSIDGRIVTASRDKTARVWDGGTGKPIGKPLKFHKDGVLSAAFSSNGKFIVTASRDGMAQVWDAETGEQIGKPLPHKSIVRSAAFSPNGELIVTASLDKTARLWDVKTGEPIGKPLTGHQDGVLSAAFSPDGESIVTASADGTARLWDVKTGNQIGELEANASAVWSAAFSLDGKRIVTASDDKTARVWDVETRKQIGKSLEGHADVVMRAAFSPDGKRIVTASKDKTAQLWDVETQAKIGAPFRHGDSVLSAGFSPDGKSIVTASDDKTARVWDIETRKQIGKQLEGHTDFVLRARYSPDGKVVITTSSDRMALLWDAKTGEQIGKLKSHGDAVWSGAFSPDGKRIVTASRDKTALLWDAATGKPIGKLEGHTTGVLSAAFSPDGKRIVTASEDKTARLWDAETGKQIRKPLEGHTESVTSAAFSPDGKLIVTTSDDASVRLWDAKTGTPIGKPLKGHKKSVRSANFSPDGKRIVTASWDTTARLWDVETGEQIVQPLEGHKDWVWSAEFSPDGRRVVTASKDKTVRLWDAETGKQIAEPLEGHQGGVWSAAFSPDGTRIVTASSDKTARLWEISASTQELVSRAKTVSAHCLTPQQRADFFLEREPPSWCIELDKWPYETPARRQ
jgi:WD40 repeat protein